MNFDGMILTFYIWICVVHCVHQARTSAWRFFTTSQAIDIIFQVWEHVQKSKNFSVKLSMFSNPVKDSFQHFE